jgi:cytochrome oxidase Cu insertion factor (SCO1/SenC/PrrC family)
MSDRIYGSRHWFPEGFGKEMTSKLITPGELAPDFELEDVNGKHVRLSDFRGNKPVVLSFLRGFM